MKSRREPVLRLAGQICVCVLLLAAAGCGCGSPSRKASEIAAEKAIEAAAKAHGQNVNLDLNSDGEGASRVTITATDGSTTITTVTGANQTEMVSERAGGRQSMRIGEKVTVPDTFPKDIPLPPDLVPKAVLHDESGGDTSWTIQGTLSGTLGDVRTFYAERLLKAGWTPLTSLDTSELLSLTYEKDDRVLSIMAGPEDNGVTLSVAVSPR